LANIIQARKRVRQNAAHREHNVSLRSGMRTSIKNFAKALQAKDVEASQNAYRSAVSQIDKTARKGLQHKNKAARLKSHMNNRLKELAAAS